MSLFYTEIIIKELSTIMTITTCLKYFSELIPEIILRQKCHINIDLIYGAMGICNPGWFGFKS
jgi:hypothetical protein